MPKTAVHMLFTLVSVATLMKLIGATPLQILTMTILATSVDLVMDLGHHGGGRSRITHSVLTAPLSSALIYIFAKTGEPILEASYMPSDVVALTALIYASILHLAWDSLTYQGIHIPFKGWVSLGNLSSRGATANLIPMIPTLILLFAFWVRF